MKLLRGVLLNNLIIKITSLILAVLTWVYIAGQLYKEDLAKKKEASSIIEVFGEKLIVKRLPIYVNIEGAPAKGYQVSLDRIAIKPSHSVVAGPSEAIKDLSYITTEPVDVSGTSSNVRKRVRLTEIPNCRMGYKDLVSVTIPITRERRR